MQYINGGVRRKTIAKCALQFLVPSAARCKVSSEHIYCRTSNTNSNAFAAIMDSDNSRVGVRVRIKEP